jgi:hypothetical protein
MMSDIGRSEIEANLTAPFILSASIYKEGYSL